MKRLSIVLLCLVSAFMGGLATTLIVERRHTPNAGTQEIVPIPESRPKVRSASEAETRFVQPPATGDRSVEDLDGDFTADERVNVEVYEAVNRSVVNINTKGVRDDSLTLFEIPTEGAGSGSVLDKKGHVLTNYHVVEGAREIRVTLFDGKVYPAELVGEDASTDIAVIRISAPSDVLYPVVLGDSARLKVGQRVFAIGNPFGLERTLTTGIVSSLNRSLPSRTGRIIKSIIQIDAAINPGNSGGPLLDSHSRLIGMNTAIASRTGQSAGVGFAIPVTSISHVVPQLIAKGHVIRPEIGITRVYESEKGLLIAALTPGGAAERAGLRGPKIVRERRQKGQYVYESQAVDRAAADLIVGLDKTKIVSADEFLAQIDGHQPGDEVVVHVIRDGKEQQIRVRLDESGD